MQRRLAVLAREVFVQMLSTLVVLTVISVLASGSVSAFEWWSVRASLNTVVSSSLEESS